MVKEDSLDAHLSVLKRKVIKSHYLYAAFCVRIEQFYSFYKILAEVKMFLQLKAIYSYPTNIFIISYLVHQ